MMSTVDQILQRWPLAAMLARCNISVPAKGKFCSPFRPDATPSCEIYGETIRDRSTGETFDAIAIFAEAHKLSNSGAIKQLAAELPGRDPQRPKSEPHKLSIPPLHYSTPEVEELAKLRGISAVGIEFAGLSLGALGFGTVAGLQCWVLSDSGRVAEARRMDGGMFPAIGTLGERKSHTLRGSCKSWPIGISPRFIVPKGLPVVLVEGGPDYLAACDVMSQARRDFLPVAMLGSGQAIHPEALPFFKGREVTILAHPDTAGHEAAKRWSAQLTKAGATVSALQLEGGDLNDIVRLHGAHTIAREVLK
jgi:hypothetical protein